MGSNETATATTGGPRVIAYLTGTGHHRAQIIYFFRMQIGPRTLSGIVLGSGGPLDSMRRCLVLPRELWIEIFAVDRRGTARAAHETRDMIMVARVTVSESPSRYAPPPTTRLQVNK